MEKNHEIFSLKDRHGKAHSYTVPLHPAAEGSALVWQLMAGASSPLIRTVVASQSGGDWMANLDVGGAAKDVTDFITKSDMLALQDKLLRYVSRDGKRLADSDEFDRAFRANYGELMQLLGKVIQVNHFLGLLDMLWSEPKSNENSEKPAA